MGCARVQHRGERVADRAAGTKEYDHAIRFDGCGGFPPRTSKRQIVPLSTRAKVVCMYALLLGANALIWALAFTFFAPPHALLLGTAVLAYTLGLRHAVDADHISAIDNVTRKLMQEGQRPVAVGFYFSLGHSTIVVALTLAIALGAGAVRDRLPSIEGIGNVLGTGISAAFLFAIAAINVLCWPTSCARIAKCARKEAIRSGRCASRSNSAECWGAFSSP